MMIKKRKYKKQETSFKNDITKIKKEYEDTLKRFNELENEHKKMVSKHFYKSLLIC